MYRAAVGPIAYQRSSLHLDLETARAKVKLALGDLKQMFPADANQIDAVLARIDEEGDHSFLDQFLVDGEEYEAWYAPNGE